MLFDLRSRGRRRTVQGVYLGLALLMGGGLVLFGVGAGNGFGGLLNAFNGNGSGSNQNQVVNQQVQTALKQINAQPEQPRRVVGAGAGALDRRRPGQQLQHRHRPRSPPRARSSSTGATQAWQHYLALTKSPGPEPGRARRPRVRGARQLRRRGERLGDRDRRQPDRRQGLRVPGGLRVRRQADPQGRSRRRPRR